MLFVLPPLTQLNTVYPSITHLTAFMRQNGVNASQTDLGIELIYKLFSEDKLKYIFQEANNKNKIPKYLRSIIANSDFYLRNISAILQFLSGKNLSISTRFANLDFWEGMYRLPDEDELEWSFGESGTLDRAKYLASLFLKNICDVVQFAVDENFQLIRYAEQLSTYLSTFDEMERELNKPLTLVGDLMIELLEAKMQQVKPKFVAISIPFPGNLLAGLQCAKYLKANYPSVKILLGGGYVNTELRQLSDTTIFKYVDYITFDDGELPTLRIVQSGDFLRTATLEDGKVCFYQMDSSENPRFSSLPAPTYSELPLDKYLNFVDTTNPMHRLWSDGHWNKLMLAHGCYWAKCAFCDTSLDYIARFECCEVSIIVDRMESMIAETGETGFHFVDEAAPPALLRKLAEEIIQRRLVVSYWTNIRFDKTFTSELAYLLAKSGCIAVSGGLEVASSRVLKLINKGVTIESASECMQNLANHNIMVHAYLMYGFPSQTVKELYDSLSIVRDMFANGLIQSAFWHRYAMTCHSPSGLNPVSVGARHIKCDRGTFANNEIPFENITPAPDWSQFTDGLNLATYNYMRSSGFDVPIKKWFSR